MLGVEGGVPLMEYNQLAVIQWWTGGLLIQRNLYNIIVVTLGT